MPEEKLHILLIEDNPDHADLFAANLSLTAYAEAQVVCKETMQGGLEQLRAKSFDLLFIDLSLKDSSIKETMAKLRELGSFCPAIVLTSLDDRSTILDIISKGAADCLPKLELNDTLLERIIHFNLDRWRLRQELFKSKEAYKDLYNNSPNMLGSIDAAARAIITCNQTFARKTGYSLAEIVGRKIDEFYHPDCLERFQQLFASFLQTGVIKNAELRLRRKDGSKIDVLLNASAVRDEQGRVMQTNSTWTDITEKKTAERKLQHVQRLNRLIIDTIPDLLWLKDADGVYLACNPRFEEFFGAPEAEIVGKTDYDFVNKELADAFRKYDRRAAAARRALVNEEWVTLASTGKDILLETTKAPLIDHDGSLTGVMGIGHDITERQEAAEKIEAASQAKSVFLSSMSHELRTPLNAILGYTQIFFNDESLSARQRNGIRTIHQAGEHLLLLINDILDISRIESGKLELLETEFRLSSFVQGITDIMQIRAKDKGLDFHVQTESLPSVIIADELRLRQVLLNLLANAVKFTGSGWCALKVRAEAAGAQRVRLHMAVEDSGPGISAEEQQLIFEPFLQAGERLQHQEGTGLGLAISRELVRLMGGELELLSPLNSRPENGAGPGCRFFFSLEAVLSKHQVRPERQPRKVIGYACPQEPRPPLRVLVVDDKLSNRAVLRDTLEPLGFLIQEAVDGSEVPAACTRFRPHIILMDLRMPNVDGFTAAARLQRQPEFRHIPVIALTASIAEGDIFRRRCLDNGFCDYVHKPYSAAELLEIMAGHLKITLLYSEIDNAPEEEIILPPEALRKELNALAEIGDIQGLVDKIAAISRMEAGKYQAFARRAQELAEDFNLTSLLDLAAGRLK